MGQINWLTVFISVFFSYILFEIKSALLFKKITVLEEDFIKEVRKILQKSLESRVKSTK